VCCAVDLTCCFLACLRRHLKWEREKTQLNMILIGHSTATLDFSIKIQGTEMHDSIR